MPVHYHYFSFIFLCEAAKYGYFIMSSNGIVLTLRAVLCSGAAGGSGEPSAPLLHPLPELEQTLRRVGQAQPHHREPQLGAHPRTTQQQGRDQGTTWPG